MELITKKYEIFSHSNGVHSLIVKDRHLANKVNKVLNYYADYKFIKGEEPLFKFYDKDMKAVLEALNVSNVFLKENGYSD